MFVGFGNMEAACCNNMNSFIGVVRPEARQEWIKSEQGGKELQIGYTDNSFETFGCEEEQRNEGVAREECWLKGRLSFNYGQFLELLQLLLSLLELLLFLF